MVIGIDNVQIEDMQTSIDLGKYKDRDEKYVHAVDSKVDLIITDNKETADYFRDNGIAALVQV